MNPPQFVLEINTCVWLRNGGDGHPLSLADVPESCLESWVEQGYDAVWLMGVWLPSETSRRIAREHPGLREDYSRALPDWREEDVGGSPFAIRGYSVNPEWGGDAALAHFRARLAKKQIRLILDFIPNHTACDHPWLTAHPDWYITGTEADMVSDPTRWFWANGVLSPRAVAHGRDPNFPAWTDTAQLDYFNPALQEAMRAELARLTQICDGVRCDMAMLEVASVFERVWGRKPAEFWPRAIVETRKLAPDFFFMAEVYWGMEETLLEMGFDAVYDKAVLDQALAKRTLAREMFDIPAAAHRCEVRFLENHDEPRIASRMDLPLHRAFAVWILGLPSTRLLYQGQTEGFQRRLPVQLRREFPESTDETVHTFYHALLKILKQPVIRGGRWQLLNPRAAWTGNESHHRILGQCYELDGEYLFIFVNLADSRSQCWVHLGLSSPAGTEVELRDLLSDKRFNRDGIALMLRGLYLDMEPWEAQIFDCKISKTQGDVTG
ncbi:alpha-amylase [candidate division KSB1 bacterium]|nr:MAG: alpha-amylase [candidate division KSB1 bacterium]